MSVSPAKDRGETGLDWTQPRKAAVRVRSEDGLWPVGCQGVEVEPAAVRQEEMGLQAVWEHLQCSRESRFQLRRRGLQGGWAGTGPSQDNRLSVRLQK